MKKLFTIGIILSSLFSTAQIKESFNYQAVVRDASGTIIVNRTNIPVRFTINSYPNLSSNTPTKVYEEETTFARTNAYGLMNLRIGTLTSTFGNFSTIDWSSIPVAQLCVSMNLNGTMEEIGCDFITSVPMALYALRGPDADPTNEIELPAGGSNGQILSTNGSGTYTWVNDSVNDADADATNEIELPTGGTNGQILSTNGSGTYSWVNDNAGSGAFITTNNLTSNNPGDLATDDFVFGSNSIDDIDNLGADDSRFLFDKSKAAFRAGRATGTEFDAALLGTYSAAFGDTNAVRGGASFAAGSSNDVIGNNAAAFGANNNVGGSQSFAFGSGLNLNSGFQFVVGVNNVEVADAMFIVANGFTGNRNAMVVRTNGNTTINGQLTLDGDNTGSGRAYTLPAQDGNATQILSSNGLGQVSWIDPPSGTGGTNLPTGGTNGQVLSTDGLNNYSWVDKDTAVENTAAPTFTTGWENYSIANGNTYEDAKYYKHDNQVFVEGLIRKTSAVNSSDTMITLPVGYRPNKQLIYNIYSENGPVRVDIHTDGRIIFNSPGFNTGTNWISLNGISFRVN